MQQTIAPNHTTDNGNRERRTMDNGFQWQPAAIRSYRKVLGVHALAVYYDLTGRVLSKNKPGENLPLEERRVRQKKIAADMGISVRQVRRSIRKLQEHGIIEVIPPKRHGEASTYILLRFGKCARTPKTGVWCRSEVDSDVANAQGESRPNASEKGSGGGSEANFDVAKAQGDRTGSPPSRRTDRPLKYLSVLKASSDPLSVSPEGTFPTPAKNAGAGRGISVSHPEMVSLPSPTQCCEEVEQLRQELEAHFTAKRGDYTVSTIEYLRSQMAREAAVLEQALHSIEAVLGPPQGQFVN